MTIVVAKQFGERIVTVSDTADFDERRPSLNLIPGILKSVIVDLRTTISFAGATERCLDAIRRMRTLILGGTNITDVMKRLAKFTSDGKCEFLVSTHQVCAELRKIARGSVTDRLEFAWLGDPQAVRKTATQEKYEAEMHDYVSRDEINFVRGFHAAFSEDVMLSEVVGGMPVTHLASPFGHTYESYMIWSLGGEIVVTPSGLDPKSATDRSDCQYDYTVHVIAPAERGVAIMGSYFVEALTGFIYSPIESDNPDKLVGIDLDRFRTAVSDRARRLGGVVVD